MLLDQQVAVLGVAGGENGVARLLGAHPGLFAVGAQAQAMQAGQLLVEEFAPILLRVTDQQMEFGAQRQGQLLAALQGQAVLARRYDYQDFLYRAHGNLLLVHEA
ncbi:hypothetical protein D3C78_1608640 [compost metagenome]